MSFGILTRDKYDNNVSIHEHSNTAFEVTLEYIPRTVEPKAKEAKGKKKPISIPFVVQFPDGTAWSVELLGSELIIHLKRKIVERAGIPILQQQLECNGKVRVGSAASRRVLGPAGSSRRSTSSRNREAPPRGTWGEGWLPPSLI